MIKDNEIVFSLSKTLFWDVDINTIDSQKHSAFIVERVLSQGTMDDFILIKNYYGKPKIKRIAKMLRYMDDRLLHFCSIYFNLSISEFRCYKLKKIFKPNWNY
ncbi:MAG: hypothetical protein A2046_10540 [Bacteroidetes bacterium GWA2_30_7]|nr:MAG: hypothetical protein A2046_10540 [Bacteroidetes bacterium GWA2_30_7]